jgi:hypothetical protein
MGRQRTAISGGACASATPANAAHSTINRLIRKGFIAADIGLQPAVDLS